MDLLLHVLIYPSSNFNALVIIFSSYIDIYSYDYDGVASTISYTTILHGTATNTYAESSTSKIVSSYTIKDIA